MKSMFADDSRLKGRTLTIYVPDLSGGGLERLQIDLAPFFIDAGFNVTFLLCRARGALLSQVPTKAAVVSLNKSRQLMTLLPLIRYFRRARPNIFLVHTEHPAILSLWARAISRSSSRVIVCQHNTLSAQGKQKHWQFRLLPLLFRRFLGWADKVVAVSAGVADDLVAATGIPRERIDVIYNGVISSNFARKSIQPVDHTWFGCEVPVIVAAGRFVEQKDFATLIAAFASVVRVRDARLVLLGEGPLRANLVELAQSLSIADKIDMPGFRPNPLPYMREASVVVLSSRFEGFGMVLAEALACGTPVVSTDCPHGPAEILDHGRYGRLTPIGDAAALAKAILATLDAPPPRKFLESRGFAFSADLAAAHYLDLFNAVLPHNGGSLKFNPAKKVN